MKSIYWGICKELAREELFLHTKNESQWFYSRLKAHLNATLNTMITRGLN